MIMRIDVYDGGDRFNEGAGQLALCLLGLFVLGMYVAPTTTAIVTGLALIGVMGE
jgi:hypothetical protein